MERTMTSVFVSTDMNYRYMANVTKQFNSHGRDYNIMKPFLVEVFMRRNNDYIIIS